MMTRLEREVWALDRCSGCGVCVAACSKGVLHWDGAQHPVLEERRKAIGLSRLKLRTCEVCDRFCEASCPRLEEQAALATRSAMSARAAGPFAGGRPSDLVRALLAAAFASGLADGALVPDMDPWTLTPQVRIVAAPEELVGLSGMQYLWAPILSKLNDAIFERRLTRLVVVGPPCVAEGARRLLESEVERLRPYRRALRLTIACSCTGMFMPDLVNDLLQRSLGIAPDQVRALTTLPNEGVMEVAFWDGSSRRLPLTKVQPFTRRGCASCHDYVGESADIAAGTVGALPGQAALIVHTGAGEALVRHASALGLLETDARVDAAALAAASAEKDRRKRAAAAAGLRVLMLDALADPARREEARKQFANLYGAPRARPPQREESNGGCRGCSGC